jgi:hypothetical protein
MRCAALLGPLGPLTVLPLDLLEELCHLVLAGGPCILDVAAQRVGLRQ